MPVRKYTEKTHTRYSSTYRDRQQYTAVTPLRLTVTGSTLIVMDATVPYTAVREPIRPVLMPGEHQGGTFLVAHAQTFLPYKKTNVRFDIIWAYLCPAEDAKCEGATAAAINRATIRIDGEISAWDK